jgi:hypothetical protein
MNWWDKLKAHSEAQRNIVGKMGNAVYRGAAFGGTAAFLGASTIAKAGYHGVAGISGGLRSGVGGYRAHRRFEQSQMNAFRATADTMAEMGPNRMGAQNYARAMGYEPEEFVKQYGKQINPKTGQAVRRFGARSAGEHLGRVGHNLWQMKSMVSLGATAGLSAMMTDDNIFDPINGMPRQLASNLGAEAGAITGAGLGAAAAIKMVPKGGMLVGGIGLVAGGLIGAEVGMMAAEGVWKISEFGNRHGRRSVNRKSQFIDSDYAATMRQRAMQSIRRSQMNARSAFGQEALAYHA